MSEDVTVFSTGDSIHVVFYIEHEHILAIGKRMNEIFPDAEMNGYNWDAFLRCWLTYNAPELLEGIGSDPETGMYEVYYATSPQNLERAKALSQAISGLTGNEDAIYTFLREYGGEIEWE